MLLTLPQLSILILITLFLGLAVTATAAIVAIVVVDRFRRNTSLLTGLHPSQERLDSQSLPFIIKDDKMERKIEDEALGYKPLDAFDIIEGLGR